MQKLYPGDTERRVEFCAWAMGEINRDPGFPRRILFSGESTFIRHGQVSRHWTYSWSRENEREIVEARDQRFEKLNVWCAIWDDTILGPYFIEGNMTGESYLNLLQNQLWPDLEPLLAANGDMDPIFMQDGCPAHNAGIVQPWLFQHFGNNIIGTHAPIRWPPRSPDLKIMDSFLWGYLKNIVYPAMTLQELRESIIRNVRSIDQGTLQEVLRNWSRRVELCFAVNGNHFEQL